MDDLAWDLGDPDQSPVPNPNPCAIDSGAVCGLAHFDPLKGPDDDPEPSGDGSRRARCTGVATEAEAAPEATL